MNPETAAMTLIRFKAGNELIERRLPHVPRVGDIVLLKAHGSGEVVRVLWVLEDGTGPLDEPYVVVHVGGSRE